MARPKAKAPALRYHLSGQSVVTIDGRDYYLGKHDSPESIARYAVLIGIYQGGGLKLPEDFDLSELDQRTATILGTQTAPQQQSNQPILVRHVTALYRTHVADKYGSARKELNRNNKLCDELDASYGDVLASEFGPVRLKSYRETLVSRGLARKYVNRIVNCVVAKAMVRVQVATGMRPIELPRMRPCDIDRSGKVWIYAPQTHKTMRTGRAKLIPIIGDAREAIEDYLNRESKRIPTTKFGGTSYQQAIKRAAAKAGVPHWYPYQLRHLTATVIRAALGIEESELEPE